MAIDIEEFHREFVQDILGTADADGIYTEDAFFERFCDYLVDAGELETADRAHYLPPKGMRVDGYGGDPRLADGVLTLIIADFSRGSAVSKISATEMETLFRRLQKFLEQALQPSFRDGLEESTAAFGLADMIASLWTSISKVRLLLISDRTLSARVDGREAGELDGRPITYGVWDLERLHRIATSGSAREDIIVDLQETFGSALPCLPAHVPGAGYEAYLAAIPAVQLASIYDRWGARLLEQNVRCFLQARGKVNKGIRNTIENDPGMFLAYNNGITATAEGIETCESASGRSIVRIQNLQIVNGGQTTASIHAASRKKDVDLSRVFIQMKLSVVPKEKAIDVVPLISEYANSQNRVAAADFFANHPFHVRMEEFSRRVWAPSADGSFKETKWFYERARGQFLDARSDLTASARKKFDLEYPRNQLVSKTDLAKYLNVWEGNPDMVSKGAQKNFAAFALAIGREWTRDETVFNERYYRHAIAKAIIFRAVERLVTGQSWYAGGYRANVVAYAIAKLGHDISSLGKVLDFDGVWKSQAVSASVTEALTISSEAVHAVITNPPPGIRNVTEWAKQQACWNRVKSLTLDLPEDLERQLLGKDEQKEASKSAGKEQKVTNGIVAQTTVLQAGATYWSQLRSWGATRKLLSPKELGVLECASSMPSKLPTEKQSLVALEALSRMREEGWHMELPGVSQ